MTDERIEEIWNEHKWHCGCEEHRCGVMEKSDFVAAAHQLIKEARDEAVRAALEVADDVAACGTPGESPCFGPVGEDVCFAATMQRLEAMDRPEGGEK